jgi:hypothetical protein
MSTNIVTDQSKNILWNARYGDDQSIVINFLDLNGDPFDITDEAFTVQVRKFSGGNVLILTEADGLTNTGEDGTLSIDFTNEELEITPDIYFILLKSTNSSTDRVRTWLNGTFVLNGELWDGEATVEETINVNIGDIIVELSITLAGGGGSTSSLPQYRGVITDFATNGFPTTGGSGSGGSIRLGDHWRLVFDDPDTPVGLNGITYYHNSIIEYTGGGFWISYPINYGDAGVIPDEDTGSSLETAYRGNWTSLESSTFPATGGSGTAGALRMGDHWRLQFSNVNTPINIGGIDYYHNSIIEYAGGGFWISYTINYGN